MDNNGLQVSIYSGDTPNPPIVCEQVYLSYVDHTIWEGVYTECTNSGICCEHNFAKFEELLLLNAFFAFITIELLGISLTALDATIASLITTFVIQNEVMRKASNTVREISNQIRPLLKKVTTLMKKVMVL